MSEPEGFESPMVICNGCGAYMPDMGRNVACEQCGDRLPTGRDKWVTSEGKPYPKEWADYEMSEG